MNTEQKYARKITNASTASSPIVLPYPYADFFGDPIWINKLRQQVRNWFCAYIPVESEHPNSLDSADNIEAYELLDSLLSELLVSQLNPPLKEIK